MTSKPRTIDNLGLDASIRYARDKQLFAPELIEDAKTISRKTEVSVVRPYIPSEYEEMFSSAKSVIWASFSPPPESLSKTSTLFSYQLIPSLGTYEEHEEPEVLLEDALQRQRDSHQDQSDKERENEEKEKKLLSDLFSRISEIDKSIELINSRRNQYQRG